MPTASSTKTKTSPPESTTLIIQAGSLLPQRRTYSGQLVPWKRGRVDKGKLQESGRAAGNRVGTNIEVDWSRSALECGPQDHRQRLGRECPLPLPKGQGRQTSRGSDKQLLPERIKQDSAERRPLAVRALGGAARDGSGYPGPRVLDLVLIVVLEDMIRYHFIIIKWCLDRLVESVSQWVFIGKNLLMKEHPRQWSFPLRHPNQWFTTERTWRKCLKGTLNSILIKVWRELWGSLSETKI